MRGRQPPEAASSLAALDAARSHGELTSNEHTVFASRRERQIRRRARFDPGSVLDPGAPGPPVDAPPWLRHTWIEAAAAAAVYRDRYAPRRHDTPGPGRSLGAEPPPSDPQRLAAYRAAASRINDALQALRLWRGAPAGSTPTPAPVTDPAPPGDWVDDLCDTPDGLGDFDALEALSLIDAADNDIALYDDAIAAGL